jgi:hypothetical protein
MSFLDGSHVLLDTCVLIDSTKYQEEYVSFYSFLSSKNVVPVLEKIVETEYLRGIDTVAFGKELLGLFFGAELH